MKSFQVQHGQCECIIFRKAYIFDGSYNYVYKDSSLISKQKEVFNELVDKRLDKITELDEKVNHNDLVYRHKGRSPDEKFNEYDNALDLINKIRNGEIEKVDVKNN